MKTTEVTRVRKYKAGYELRDEYWEHDPKEIPFLMKRVAYNPQGEYIGTSKDAYYLVVKKGIAPIKISDYEHAPCQIGFCEKEQKWYGWSHRAIYGFGIGDKVKKGDCCASSGYIDEYIKEHPEKDKSLPIGFIAKTLDDAKTMAIAFAESVS